jgi:hypothetical protein
MISEEVLRFDEYDDLTLSIKCPECNAAVGGKCLKPKTGGYGGQAWMKEPHRARVLAAHGKPPDTIWD